MKISSIAAKFVGTQIASSAHLMCATARFRVAADRAFLAATFHTKAQVAPTPHAVTLCAMLTHSAASKLGTKIASIAR
jgi:hypothetical protein